MSFLDMENPDSLPLFEPAPGVDILVTQHPCEEEVPVADGMQARCWKVEIETEKQARLNHLREEKSLKWVVAEKRKCIRDHCGKEVEARRRATQRTTIAAYFRREDPRDCKRKRGDDGGLGQSDPQTYNDGSNPSVEAYVPGSAEKNAINLLSSDSSGLDVSLHSGSHASASSSGSTPLLSPSSSGGNQKPSCDDDIDDALDDDIDDSDSDSDSDDDIDDALGEAAEEKLR
jgi:hypothetical protein